MPGSSTNLPTFSHSISKCFLGIYPNQSISALLKHPSLHRETGSLGPFIWWVSLPLFPPWTAHTPLPSGGPCPLRTQSPTSGQAAHRTGNPHPTLSLTPFPFFFQKLHLLLKWHYNITGNPPPALPLSCQGFISPYLLLFSTQTYGCF